LSHRFFLETPNGGSVILFRQKIPYNRFSLTGRCGCGIITITNGGKHGMALLLLAP
jgi:hypothetical protein